MPKVEPYPSPVTCPQYAPPSLPSAEAPKKFVKINGIMQINPAWQAAQESQGNAAATALQPQVALPVVSNMEQYTELCETSPVSLAETCEKTIDFMQDPRMCAKVGVSQDAWVDELGKLFVKHEAPMGLMKKLMGLSEYDLFEFIIDDSGSMTNRSDTKDKYGHPQSRWEEALNRMKEIIELMAFTPVPEVRICFMNRRDEIMLVRRGEVPERFIDEANRKLDQAFNIGPSGNTPALRCLQNSFNRGKGKNVARYFFCDGEPSGGDYEKQEIAKLVTNRHNPKGNPLTFLSCTENDEEAEWMKETEELAPYCAEYDDFKSEAKEVLRDQGAVLPFTKGFYLIGQLVAAMNPDDLDAMDESVPFTKWTLDNLLGQQTTEEEYRRYFDGFKEAQRKRRIDDEMDKYKANFPWDAYYHDFTHEQLARNISGVKKFKKELNKSHNFLTS